MGGLKNALRQMLADPPRVSQSAPRLGTRDSGLRDLDEFSYVTSLNTVLRTLLLCYLKTPMINKTKVIFIIIIILKYDARVS